MSNLRIDGTPARDRTDPDARHVSIGIRLSSAERELIEEWADSIGKRPSVAARSLLLAVAGASASRAATTPQEMADAFAAWLDADLRAASEEKVETMERESDRFRG